MPTRANEKSTKKEKEATKVLITSSADAKRAANAGEAAKEKGTMNTKNAIQETAEAPLGFSAFQNMSAIDRLRMVRVWTVVGAIIILMAVFSALGHLGPVILFLAVSIILGFICSPIVNFLENHSVSRTIGAAIALIVVLGALVGIVALLGPPATEQFLSLLNRVPAYMHEVQVWLKSLFDNSDSISMFGISANIQTLWDSFTTWGTKMASETATEITNGLLPSVMNTANNIFMFFLGIICAYWLAADYPTIVKEFSIIAGPKHRKDLSLLLAVTSRSMGGYMRGIVITSAVGGFLAFVGFLIVGQPYAPLMGIITMLFHFVPVVGPWFSAAIATITAFIVSPICALWTLIVAIVAENVTDNLISPLVMKKTVQVHPAMSLLAIVIGSALGGAVGVAVSIPISAAIKGVFIYYFETKTDRQIVSYNGAFFQGTPFVNGNGSIVPSADALDDDNFYDTSRLVSENNLRQNISPRPKPKKGKKHGFFHWEK